MSPGRLLGPIQPPTQQVLWNFVIAEADHSPLSSAELRIHESTTLVFPYALMACGKVLNKTQGHGSTHIIKHRGQGSTHISFCELPLVTISGSVLFDILYWEYSKENNTTWN